MPPGGPVGSEAVSQDGDGQDVSRVGTTGMAGYPGPAPVSEGPDQPADEASNPGGMDSLAETLASPLTEELSDKPPAPDMGGEA